MPEKVPSFRRGVTWVFLDNTGGQILLFVFGIILARLLAPEIFGMLVTVQIFTGFATFVAGGGMGQALVRGKDIGPLDYNIVFTLQILIGILIYTAFFIAAPYFAAWYDMPIYEDLFRIVSLTFLIRPFVNVPTAVLTRQMRFKGQAVISLAALLVSSMTSVALAYHGHGVWSLVIGGLVGSLVRVALLFPVARWKPGLSTDLRRGREHARYGMMVSLVDIVNYLKGQLSVFILSKTLGPASVGLYNKSQSLAKMPMSFIAGSVYKVSFRAMAAEQDNEDKVRYLYVRSIALVGVYATPFYIGFLWLAEPLVRGLYGQAWVEAAAPLKILALAWPAWLLANMSGAVLAARDWLGRELALKIVMLFVGGVIIYLGHFFGIVGVAYAVVLISVLNAIFMVFFALRCINGRFLELLRSLTPAALLNAILAVVLIAADWALPTSIRGHDLVFAGAMTMIGALGYGLSFLFLPIPQLERERQRWLDMIKRVLTGRG